VRLLSLFEGVACWGAAIAFAGGAEAARDHGAGPTTVDALAVIAAILILFGGYAVGRFLFGRFES